MSERPWRDGVGKAAGCWCREGRAEASGRGSAAAGVGFFGVVLDKQMKDFLLQQTTLEKCAVCRAFSLFCVGIHNITCLICIYMFKLLLR